MEKQIHWFPGHMKKAQIDIESKIKIVDCVIELLDSRIPLSSRNKILSNITKNKKKLIVLTKSDLADSFQTKKWIEYFNKNHIEAIFCDLNKKEDIKKIINSVIKLGEEKNNKYIEKGMKPQPIRAMVIGIPNVGKSTLINKLSNRKAALVQNKPGLTKSQQWIKVSNKFELLDTPGILQSNYEEKENAINLALVGSIKQDILPIDELSKIAYDFLKTNYLNELIRRFPYLSESDDSILAFDKIAKMRGYLASGKLDIYKTQTVFLNELKNGIIGKITFELCH